jgi:ribonuclease P protein component
MPAERRAVSASASERPAPISPFPRRQRLIDSRDFQRVLRGRKISRKHGQCRLYGMPNDIDIPRLGLIISKRSVRKAVRRNRLKRIVRESFRLHAHLMPPLDLVIQLTGDPMDGELRSILADLWPRTEADSGGGRADPIDPMD